MLLAPVRDSWSSGSADPTLLKMNASGLSERGSASFSSFRNVYPSLIGTFLVLVFSSSEELVYFNLIFAVLLPLIRVIWMSFHFKASVSPTLAAVAHITII
jgi:hypothetical protein